MRALGVATRRMNITEMEEGEISRKEKEKKRRVRSSSKKEERLPRSSSNVNRRIPIFFDPNHT
jgi:hypothetical protein